MKYILILALFLTGCSGGSGGSGAPAIEPKEIYVLLGQSNMTRSDYGRSYNYLCDAYGDNGWEKASTPLIQYSSIKKRVSLGRIGIADGFSESICSEGIGLVIHARDGMKVDDISKGTEFYNSLISKMSSIGEYNIKAFLWHQGEASRFDRQYAIKLANFIDSIRYDTQYAPFIIGEINGDSIVNEQLNTVPYMSEDTHLITSKGLNTHDGVHFTERSAIEYGYKYADKVRLILPHYTQ